MYVETVLDSKKATFCLPLCVILVQFSTMSTAPLSTPQDEGLDSIEVVGGQQNFDALYQRSLEYFAGFSGSILLRETLSVASTQEAGLQLATETFLRNTGDYRELSDVQRAAVARALVQKGYDE